jgi:5-methylcytosine-specific restriction endonuclease McrA
MIYFDRTCMIRSGRQNYTHVWVVCDFCGSGRWAQKHNAMVLPDGQPCKSCSGSKSAQHRRAHDENHKQCSKCGEIHPLSAFTKRKGRADGYRGKCNACMAKEARERRARNPEKVREQHRQAQRNRRARAKQSPGQFTREDWLAILDRYGHKCLCCGTKGELQPDHVIPLSVGGTNTVDNIQPLCGACNRKKQANIIDYRIAA